MVDEMQAYQDSIKEVGRVVAESSKNIGVAVTNMVNCRAKLHTAVDTAAATVSSNIASDMAAVPRPA